MSETVSLTIAGASLLVSLYVLWKQRHDSGRAHFTAEWADSRTLVYVNHGPGPARDVKAVLRSSMDRDQEQESPYVGALQSSRVPVLRLMGETFGPFEVTWRDNRRTEQRVSVTLHAQPNPQPSRPARNDGPDLEKAVRKIALDAVAEEMVRGMRGRT